MINQQRIIDLVTCAFEGGSNYWYQIVSGAPENTQCYVAVLEGHLMIADTLDGNKAYKLNKDVLLAGMSVMANKYPRHYGDFVNDQEDATTGDVFLQCCLFGGVKYG